jgi:hypothetical protein
MKDEALKLALEALETLVNGSGFAPAKNMEKAREAITAIKQARSAPVQEPDGYVYGNSYWEATNPRITDDVKRFGSPRYATPPAQPVTEDSSVTQPAVPDAIIEAGESPDFRDGWNECRETMLQMLKARTT